jgi:hypothetical protein
MCFKSSVIRALRCMIFIISPFALADTGLHPQVLESAIPPPPPEPHIPTTLPLPELPLPELPMPETSSSSSPKNIPALSATAWIFQFNRPEDLAAAENLMKHYQQQGTPAFLIPAPSHQAYIAIGPEIDPNRLNLLKTRVNIDPKLGTVRRFQVRS